MHAVLEKNTVAAELHDDDTASTATGSRAGKSWR